MEPSGAQIAIALTVAYTDNDRPSTPHPIRAGLWVINVATRTPQLLVAARCQGLAWSPNGRTGAYEVVSRLGVSSIDTVTAAANARPKQIATLTDQASSPPAQTTLSWSRDGKTIVVCNVKRVLTAASSAALETEIDAYPAKGGPPTTIPAPVSYPTKVYQGAAYSPTGQSLVGAALHYATPASNSISSGSTTHPAVASSAGGLPTLSTQILGVPPRPPCIFHDITTLQGDARLVGW